MRGFDLAAGAAAIALIGSLVTASPASAQDWGVDISGTWRVRSDGEWARVNDVKIEQQTVIQTWTISTDCVSPIECAGEVRSDQGWTAPIYLDDFWYVKRPLPHWVPCPDGTFVDGEQMFLLWGVDPTTNESVKHNIQIFAGRDVAKGPSGACGINKNLVIEMPVRMQKL